MDKETLEKVDEAIINIADSISKNLEHYQVTVEETTMPDMIKALAELVQARATFKSTVQPLKTDPGWAEKLSQAIYSAIHDIPSK